MLEKEISSLSKSLDRDWTATKKREIVSNDMLLELIDNLQGTCHSLNSVCESMGFTEDDLTLVQLAEIDNWYTHCPTCGWWVESYEMYDEDTCCSCHESEEEQYD